MKKHLFKLFIFLLLSSQVLVAEEEKSTTENEEVVSEEEKKVYIEELVEDFDEIPGFFTTFRDPKTNQVFLKITNNQLRSEFIYFAHALNGVASVGKVKGFIFR